MVTDTALFRYPHYHTAKDTPDKINYDRLARVVIGLKRTIADLVDARNFPATQRGGHASSMSTSE